MRIWPVHTPICLAHTHASPQRAPVANALILCCTTAAAAINKKKTLLKPIYKTGFRSGEASKINEVKKNRRIVRRRTAGKSEKYIKNGHEQYALTFCMMQGIRHSVGRHCMATNMSLRDSNDEDRLTPRDFMRTQKYKFAPEGTRNTMGFPTTKYPKVVCFLLIIRNMYTNVLYLVLLWLVCTDDT